ncbi:MAG: acyltransferase [Chloroflexota bacterium]|nr:acyltransferase [Chloroflexota bacterium]
MRQEGNAPADSGEGRIVAIDILRGVAIIWVVLFHLWGDLEFFPGAPQQYYEQLTWQIRHGEGAWRIFTSCTDLLFRDGFQGVPLFMMISGLSLTIAAYRARDAMSLPRFFASRFRKLLIPYWVGVALTYGVIALIAWRQLALGGSSFADQFSSGITISLYTHLSIDSGVVFASIALLPRLTGPDWFFAPQLALWFVGLLAQYYLLFPLLFFVMRRIGVVAFLLLTFGVTVAANWWIVDNYGAPEFKFWLVTGWAPFRLFEFTAGMAIGWLLASPERHRALAIVRNPVVLIAAVAAGIAAHTTGDLMIGRWTVHYWQSLALPLSTLGLALLALPLLVRRPGRIDAAAPVRALTTVGVMSYAILIVSDAMRLVASQIRVEAPSDALWRTFLVGVYVPATLLLAWPLAHALGLMPRRHAPPADAPAEQPAAYPSPLPDTTEVLAT